jgi:flagellar hook-associated protein 3
MKVTESSTYRLMQTNLERITSKLQDLRNQGATGLKLNKPSDDPASIRPVLTTRTQIRDTDRYLETMGVASDKMAATDGYMAGIENILQRAKEITTSAINSAMSTADLATLADEISQLKQQLLDSANATVDGKYIFAGYKENTVPFVENPNYLAANYDPQDVTTWPYLYQGDNNPTNLEITPGEYLQTNITGNELFMGITNAIAANGYSNPYQGQTLTGGNMSLPAGGDITITSGTNSPITLSAATDLTDTDNNYAGKVAALFSQSGTGAFAIAHAATTNLGPLSLTGFDAAESDTYSLSITSGGTPITVTLDGGTPPAGYDYSLDGLNSALANTPGTINVTATGGTLDNGISYDISSGSLVLTGPADGSEIELAETITDNGVAGASGGITGGSQTVYGTLSITTNTANNVTLAGTGLASVGLAASTLAGASGRIDIFTALTQAEENLRTNNIAGMQNDLNTLETAANQERVLRSRLGNRATRVEAAITQEQSVKIDLAQILSRYQDADIIATFNNITAQETAFQAALSITAKISKISILDYM